MNIHVSDRIDLCGRRGTKHIPVQGQEIYSDKIDNSSHVSQDTNKNRSGGRPFTLQSLKGNKTPIHDESSAKLFQ